MKPIGELAVIDDPSGANQSVEDLFRALDYPLPPDARATVQSLIDADATMLERAVLRRKHGELADARAGLFEGRARHAAHANVLAGAREQYAVSPSGSWVLSLLMTPFFLACLGMEFILSWVTLPLLMGVDRYTPLGIMLGIGPTGAVAVLKIVVARLVEEPYRQLLASGAGGRAYRAGVLAVMVAFMVSLGAFNVYTIVLQADVREAISATARDLLEGDNGEPARPIESRDSVVAISVAAAVDGALFFLVAWNEGQMWRRRRSARQSLERAEQQGRALDREVAQAEAVLDALLHEDIRAAASVARERRCAELLVILQREESQQEQSRSALATATRRLRAVTT